MSRPQKRSVLFRLVELIYNIAMEDLSPNCRNIDHVEYILYRLDGGRKSEENWFKDQCK